MNGGGGKLAAFTVYYLVFNTGNLSWRIMDKVIKFLYSLALSCLYSQFEFTEQPLTWAGCRAGGGAQDPRLSVGGRWQSRSWLRA